MAEYIRWFNEITYNDVPVVGGKNASLGEMTRSLVAAGIRVPDGFAITAEAYRYVVRFNELDQEIGDLIDQMSDGRISLRETGHRIRAALVGAEIPPDLRHEILRAYLELSRRFGVEAADVAVRSSSTAEDLPDASFAGQQETFLNVTDADDLLVTVRRCFASLFTDRAIYYRQEKGFEHLSVALSIGIQKMARSDRGAAGVAFTLDTETGFPDVVVIDAAYGLGESVVGGLVTPDEYRVFKPLLTQAEASPIFEKRLGRKETTLIYAGRGEQGRTRRVITPEHLRDRFVLSDEQILTLARWARKIEQHYGCPMDVEWALDGDTGELFVVQARPETVQSRVGAGTLKTWELRESAEPLCEGTAVGQGIAAGRVRMLRDASQADQLEEGDILVTGMTDPDWVPIMKRAAAIVTDAGGRTSHAAIVSRELGIPAIVGCGDATERLVDRQAVTASCAEGDRGFVYPGQLQFEAREVDTTNLPTTRTKVQMIVGSPQTAFRWWNIPFEGVGLARMEFIINGVIRAHPLALLDLDRGELRDEEAAAEIRELIRGFPSGEAFFVDRLARGMAGIAAACWPHPVIVRMSDFKTNEYADLIGGRAYEPVEANPMLGWRGASRYYSTEYRPGFDLECRALRMARLDMGFSNLTPMIPFCRTPQEADRVLEVMATNGLERGVDGLQVFVMIEVPSNVILADQFAERFDGFSIGSNDLTQLTLGVDRDSSRLAPLFDGQHEAVKRMLRSVIKVANDTGTKIGLCGQEPSDHPEFAKFLVECGIDAISVNPDSLVRVRMHVAEAEAG
ncbi:MAG: phosphoenolpyruvate synthase [Deltaproteobacteria bacterium]|nr:MAG: phosphoenolpyruvate synthase [Deltaproteobacteria bacterium]